jgi:hypothetical protein
MNMTAAGIFRALLEAARVEKRAVTREVGVLFLGDQRIGE